MVGQGVFLTTLPFFIYWTMRESVFRFKQFAVRNSMAAMKVGTDGVLLGAWCPVEGALRVLDVGTGTGLIALMVAQRNVLAMIDAVDIDHAACDEAGFNVANSPWHERINVECCDFMEYCGCGVGYDLIVSNPPYFDNGLLPPDYGRRLARHCGTLTYAGLIAHAASLLSPSGKVCIITPADAATTVTCAAEKCGLGVNRRTMVRPKPGSDVKRILWELSACATTLREDELVIEGEEHHDYTPQYVALTKDFYLKM